MIQEKLKVERSKVERRDKKKTLEETEISGSYRYKNI